MKNDRRIDSKTKQEARMLRLRLSATETASTSQGTSLYELYLGELTSVAGKVAPATAAGLR